jgi:hypothetical protein
MRTDKDAFTRMLKKVINKQARIQFRARNEHEAVLAKETRDGSVGELRALIETLQSGAVLKSILETSESIQRMCELAINRINCLASDQEEDEEDEEDHSTPALSDADHSEMAEFIDDEYSASDCSHAESVNMSDSTEDDEW